MLKINSVLYYLLIANKFRSIQEHHFGVISKFIFIHFHIGFCEVLHELQLIQKRLHYTNHTINKFISKHP